MRQRQKKIRKHIDTCDQSIHMDKIGLISETCKQSISHGEAWKIVQRFGERVVEEENHLVQEMNADQLKPENTVNVLFEEMDGVWLKMQGKNHKPIPKQEMKVSTIYAVCQTGRNVLRKGSTGLDV